MSAALSSSAVYEVKGVHSNKCMDIDGASTQNGANVQIWSCLGNGAQQFKFEDMGGGWYRIRNVNSGKCLDVYNWSTSAGGDVRQWDCHTGNNQQWTVEESGGQYHFINRHSGKALDVAGWSTSDGGNIQQWDWLNNNTQKFYVTQVGGGGGGGGGGGNGDAVGILADHGFNYARIRVLPAPPGNYGLHQDQNYVVEVCKTARSHGMKVLLDFFYSNWWADPQQQNIPHGWSGSSDDISYHTWQVLNAMKNASGCGLPDMVQIGNEVNSGMLWPAGQITWNPNNFSNFVARANVGYDTVKGFSSSIKVMIHYAGAKGNGFDAPWWYGAYMSAGGKVDVFGLSYYPMWHGPISNVVNALNSLSSRGKDMYIVETATHFTTSPAGYSSGYPQTKQGQYNYLYDLTNQVKNINRFKGIFYWGATWAQTDQWLDAPAWTDDTWARALFDSPSGSTATLNMAADAMLNAGGLSVRGVDVSEARYAQQHGVIYAD